MLHPVEPVLSMPIIAIMINLVDVERQMLHLFPITQCILLIEQGPGRLRCMLTLPLLGKSGEAFLAMIPS